MSSLITDCLEYAFGITNIECECIEDNRPSDYDASDSGLFLDEIISLKMFKENNCFEGDLWTKITASKREALNILKADVIGCVANNAQLTRKVFKGIIGDPQKVSSRDESVGSNTKAGMKMYAANIVGGKSSIRRIGLALNTTGTYELNLYSNQSDVALGTYTLNATANKLTWNDVVIELPLESDYNYNLIYYFVVTLPTNVKPKEVKTDCGCGSGFKPFYNINAPSFNSMTPKGQFEWANYVMVTGIQGSDISIIDDWRTQGNHTNGVLLDIQFSCNTETVICNGDLDYQSDPIAMALAGAYRYLTAYHLALKIIRDPEPTKFTMLPFDQLAKDVSLYSEEYNKRVQYICSQLSKPENINRSSDCFMCKEISGARKGSILK